MYLYNLESGKSLNMTPKVKTINYGINRFEYKHLKYFHVKKT